MNKSDIVYKIRDKRTGLFSKGGFSSSDELLFEKMGKTWTGLGPLKNHLRMFNVERFANWEVVTMALVEIDKIDVNIVLGGQANA